MIKEILTYLLTIGLPFLVMYGCKHSKRLDAIGPVIILYAAGLIASFCGLKSNAQTILSSLTVPLAIPLILFGNEFKMSKGAARDPLLALLSCLVSAFIAIVGSFLIFRPDVNVAGMVTGCLTGGTMNMASIKLALGVDDSVFILTNTYDMAVCFTYLMFILIFGIKLSRRILPQRTNVQKEALKIEDAPVQKATVKDYAFVIGVALICCGISYAVSKLLFSESVFMLVFILVLTALGIGLSFVKKVRTTPGSYDSGMYFVYAFSFVVASMADFKGMSISENLSLLGFYSLSVFGSLFLHILFSYILKIDADTAVIASNAFINAPPTVPVVASAQKNRTALTSGLTIGIFGYAVGTYIGVFVAKILSLL